MAEINEKVTVDTDAAQTNLRDLKDDTDTADKALDELKETAGKVDQEEVKIPVEISGAKQAADDLEQVDVKARAAGEGAKTGVSGISDMTGPFGEASSKAGELGQAMEGVTGLVGDMAGKMGLSEEATGKLTATLGFAAVGVAAAAAAWTIYNGSQDRAKKGADEVRDALGSVYEKLKEGDAQAAARTFIDTMGEKIEKLRDLVGGAVTQADIAGVIFGDPASIAAVDSAIGKLDGTARVLAEGGMNGLSQSWGHAKTAFEETIALETKVQSFFGNVDAAAANTKTNIDNVAASWGNMNMIAAGPAVPVIPQPTQMQGGLTAYINNNYPPANTPIAVDQATTRHAQIQGPR